MSTGVSCRNMEKIPFTLDLLNTDGLSEDE